MSEQPKKIDDGGPEFPLRTVIAKDVLVALIDEDAARNHTFPNAKEIEAREAVAWADALIAALGLTGSEDKP